MFTFNKRYLLFSVILFIVEVLIALFVRDSFVRPYIGDYLVVVLVYCAIRTFVKLPVWKAALAALLFAYVVEVLQYFQIVKWIGLEKNAVVRTVVGTGFDWKDLAAYTFGILSVIILEKLIPTSRNKTL